MTYGTLVCIVPNKFTIRQDKSNFVLFHSRFDWKLCGLVALAFGPFCLRERQKNKRREREREREREIERERERERERGWGALQRPL